MIKHKKFFAILLVVSMIFSLTACLDYVDYSDTEITDENKVSLIDELGIDLYEQELVKGKIPNKQKEEESEEKNEQFNYELPDINNYEPDIKGDGDIDVEIFLPLENNGSNIRDLVKYASESFNSLKKQNSNGKTMSVTIRSLDSSLAEDFIQYGAYMPKGYIASN